MRTLKTESGSTYIIDGDRIRRVNPYAGKRADGEWIKLLTPLHDVSYVGFPVRLKLESLGVYGPDDEGNRHGGEATYRMTSIVTYDSIEEEKESND